MCILRYIELGVGSPTLFNPQLAPFILCFGKRRVPLISQGTLYQIYKSRRHTVSPCCSDLKVVGPSSLSSGC